MSIRNKEYSIFLAGDLIITRPWSETTDPEFMKLISEIRKADVSIANLEMLIHTFKGYPEKWDGTPPMAAEPNIAKELRWAGFDMLGHANNHTNDYGVTGILETKGFIEGAGIQLAGSGEDLQRAREPKYYENNWNKVALLSATQSFKPNDVASLSRHDLHGHPGLNPLGSSRSQALWGKVVKKLAYILGISSQARRLKILNHTFILDCNKLGSSYNFNANDLEANLEAVRNAKKNADIAVMSFHIHQGNQWMPQKELTDFAHLCIDNGVDIFFAHGPHYIKGIEIYKGRPIFHSLGNFVFQLETIKKIPAEYYLRKGLDDTASPEDYQKLTRNDWKLKQFWESIAATVLFSGGVLEEIRLIPISLGYDLPFGLRGQPVIADADHGRSIINNVIERSTIFGTAITYCNEENIGIVSVTDRNNTNFQLKQIL